MWIRFALTSRSRQIEQTTLDLILEEDEEYEFELVGKKYVGNSLSKHCSSLTMVFSAIYLSGNYIGMFRPPKVDRQSNL